MVTIKLHLTLVGFYNKDVIIFDIKQPILLIDILDQLSIPVSEVGMVVKNGKWEPMECEVSGNDFIELFPVLYGG